MQTSDKQLKKSAEKAKSATENLQSSAIVNNFATILYINPMTDFGFKKIARQKSNVGCIICIIWRRPKSHWHFRT